MGFFPITSGALKAAGLVPIKFGIDQFVDTNPKTEQCGADCAEMAAHLLTDNGRTVGGCSIRWLSFVDVYRTKCRIPGFSFRLTLEAGAHFDCGA